MNKELSRGTIVSHSVYGKGIIGESSFTFYEIYFENKGRVEISKAHADLTVISVPENEPEQKNSLTLADVEEVVTYIMDKYGALQEIVPIGSKWEGGTLIMNPGKPDIKGKEIPIETFFHKIVMVRDRLRVLEQNINSHEKLTDEEKVNLQQYITRIYGSLTTFNIMFAEKDHYFTGAKS